MKTGLQSNAASSLNSFSKNCSLLKTNIAIITFHRIRYSHIFNKLLLLIEYLQLLSQTILINPTSYQNHPFDKGPLTKAIVYFSQMINPSYLLPFNTSSIFISVILLIIVCFIILKCLLSLYIVYLAFQGTDKKNWLVDIWRILFKLQRPVTCFLINSFWIKVMIEAQNNSFTIFGMSDFGVTFLSSTMFVLESVFTLLIEAQFKYILPSHSFLSCKNSQVQIITLTQKLVIQVLQISIIESDTIAAAWGLSSLNLAFTILRNILHFITLPLYKLEALSFQTALLAVVSSLHLSFFVQTFMDAISFEGADISFMFILWAIFCPVSVRIAKRMLKRKIEMLLLSQTSGLPEMLMHKVIVTQQLKKQEKLEKIIGISDEKYKWTYLVSVAQKVCIKDVFSVDTELDETISENINETEHDNRIYIHYLKKLSEKFPKNDLLKLFIAYFYANKMKLYAKATKIISEFRQSTWTTAGLNASLLVYDIQKVIISGHYTDSSQLDLSGYLQSQILVEELKQKMAKQVDVKVNICRNILEEKANLGEISQCAQSFNKSKIEIEKIFNVLYTKIPEHFIEPLLLCAKYHLVMNYSLEDSSAYQKLYDYKVSKYSKYLNEGSLIEENLYDKNNVFLILSGQKSDNGKILYCSKSIEKICGGDHASYIGSHISRILTPSLQGFFTNLFSQALETKEGNVLNTITRSYLRHKDGHVVEVDFCVKVHPFITQSLYLNLIIRPVPSTTEYLLVRENGDIEGSSKHISHILGISNMLQQGSSLINVKALSKELVLMNELIEGREIELKALITGQSRLYYCKVSDILYETISLKKMMLEAVHDLQQSEMANQAPYENDNDLSVSEDKEIEEILEEKQGGWINLLSLRSATDYADTLITQNRAETNGNNLLSSTTRGNLLSSYRLKSPKIEKQATAVYVDSGANADGDTLSAENKIISDKKKLKADFYNSSDSLNKKRMSKSFQAAINTTYYPKSFKGLCLAFYAVIFITFLCLIGLRIITDNAMTDLVIKKNMLNYSQLRMFHILRIQSLSRTSVEYMVLRFTPTELGQAQATAKTPLNGMIRHLPTLIDANKNFSRNAGLLDSKMRDVFLEKDVRIFGSAGEGVTQSYANFTSHQAIDIVIGAVEFAMNLKNAYTPQGRNVATFLMGNLMDDLLAKNKEITGILSKSVEEQRVYLQDLLIYALIIILVFLLTTAGVLTFNIWYQYNVDKRLILELLKLNPIAVKNVLQSSENFKRSLSDDDAYWDEKQQIGVVNDPFLSINDKIEGGYNKRKHEHQINSRKLARKYWLYLIKLTLNIALLVGLTIWNNVSTRNDVVNIYVIQSQLQYANAASRTLALAYSSTNEIFLSNDTMLIEGQIPSLKAKEIAKDMKRLQSEAANKFMGQYKTYDPRIKTVLFDEGCKIISVPADVTNCLAIQSQGRPTSFLSVLADFGTIVEERLARFDASDKSYQAFKEIFISTFTPIIPDFRTNAAQIQEIATILNASLDRSIDDSYYNRDKIMIVFLVCLIGVSFTVWYQILSQLRNVNNDFKKMLQVFPPNLILSNFILKRFLMKTLKEMTGYVEL